MAYYKWKESFVNREVDGNPLTCITAIVPNCEITIWTEENQKVNDKADALRKEGYIVDEVLLAPTGTWNKKMTAQEGQAFIYYYTPKKIPQPV